MPDLLDFNFVQLATIASPVALSELRLFGVPN
jgi:hypothetical protein